MDWSDEQLRILSVKYSNRRKNSRKRGISFEIPFEKFCELAACPWCFYTNRFIKCIFNNTSNPESYTWTLDRIDCKKGYEKGNVVVCSHIANLTKNMLLECPSQRLDFTKDIISAQVLKALDALKEGIRKPHYWLFLKCKYPLGRNSKGVFFFLNVSTTCIVDLTNLVDKEIRLSS